MYKTMGIEWNNFREIYRQKRRALQLELQKVGGTFMHFDRIIKLGAQLF